MRLFHHQPWRLIAAAAMLCLSFCLQAKELVLVTSPDSRIAPMDMQSVRQIFVGVPLSQDQTQIQAQMLIGDKALEQLFYIALVGMTEQSWQRKNLQLRLAGIGRALPEHRNSDALANRLHSEPDAIGYMWREDADRHSLRIVQRIWQNEAN